MIIKKERDSNETFISINSIISISTMINHRFYIIFFLIFIHINIQLALECNEHYSNEHDAPFSTKIQESPFVMIGTSLNKNFDLNIQNLFNVTFLVQCILKGRPTQRIIQIVQAGENILLFSFYFII